MMNKCELIDNNICREKDRGGTTGRWICRISVFLDAGRSNGRRIYRVVLAFYRKSTRCFCFPVVGRERRLAIRRSQLPWQRAWARDGSEKTHCAAAA